VSDPAFLESNIQIQTTLDTDGVSRHVRSNVEHSLMRRGGVISVQVLNKFANVARRKLRRAWLEIMRSLSDIRALFRPPVPLTLATHVAAVALAVKYGFSFYDALIVASALEAGCTILLSEDMHDGLVVEGRLTVRNPFRRRHTSLLGSSTHIGRQR